MPSAAASDWIGTWGHRRPWRSRDRTRPDVERFREVGPGRRDCDECHVPRAGHKLRGRIGPWSQPMQRLTLAFVAVLVLSVAGPVAARITPKDQDRLLPPAISDADLAKYLERLSANDDQRRVAYTSYAIYEREYSVGKTDSIQRLAALADTIDRAPFPPPGTATEFLQVRKLAMVRLHDFDELLLAAVEDSLVPEQLSRMPFVRLARERTFYDITFLDHFPEIGLDLVQLLGELDLTKDSFQRIQPAVDDYQIRMAAVVRSRHDAAIDLCERVLAGLRGASIDDEMAKDPKNFREVMPHIASLFIDNERTLVEANNRIARTNREYALVLTSLLPDASTKLFKQRYNLICFPSVYDRHDTVETKLAGIRPDRLGMADQLALARLIQQYRESRDDITRQMVVEITTYRENGLSFSGLAENEEARSTHEAKILHLEQRLSEMEISSAAALEELSARDKEPLEGAH